MEWRQLLCADRLGRDRKSAPHDPARSEFRRDADRIIFSTAFRRLQDKTQVFPLAENDYVRTRLTHSLEVASVGRSLGARIGSAVCKRHPLPGVHPSDFGEIVSAAALAHDLGNPPFGHSGEDAIRHWFRTSDIAQQASAHLTERERADIENFEGNAQGFRVITRLQMPDNAGGMQLTCATLGAFTKYPRESVLSAPQSQTGASVKKFGFYQSERDHFRCVAERCGLLRRSEEAASWVRHPLAFLVEAADDICYRLVDFEDGFRLGYIGFSEVHDAFMAVINEDQRPKRLQDAQSDRRRVQILRAIAIGTAIEQAADVFIAHESEILDGTFDQPLIEASVARDAWAEIQRRSIQTIYATPRGVAIEAAGFEVLGGLLDVFVSASNDVAANRCPSARSRKLLQLLPPEMSACEYAMQADGYHALLQMLDFVSGMTDSYAVALYKQVRGISLPGR